MRKMNRNKKKKNNNYLKQSNKKKKFPKNKYQMKKKLSKLSKKTRLNWIMFSNSGRNMQRNSQFCLNWLELFSAFKRKICTQWKNCKRISHFVMKLKNLKMTSYKKFSSLKLISSMDSWRKKTSWIVSLLNIIRLLHIPLLIILIIRFLLRFDYHLATVYLLLIFGFFFFIFFH